MASSSPALSQPEAAVNGSRELVTTQAVEMYSNWMNWVGRQVQIDNKSSCCTVTKPFLEGSEGDESLLNQKCYHECQDPSHVEKLRLRVRAVDSGTQDWIVFCLVNHDEAVAVMTGNEPCFGKKSHHGLTAAIGMENESKGE